MKILGNAGGAGSFVERPIKAYVGGQATSTGSWETIVDITNGAGIVELLQSTTTSSQCVSFRVTVDGIEVFNSKVGGFDAAKNPWLGYTDDAGFAPFGFTKSCKVEMYYAAAGYYGNYGVRVFA